MRVGKFLSSFFVFYINSSSVFATKLLEKILRFKFAQKFSMDAAGGPWADSPTSVPHRYSAAPSPPTIASSSRPTSNLARTPCLRPYGISR